ncbi:hypothetical protein [Novosphingobium sp.]|uniref:hypothetical protein n=1 Tax=Novosphingobium sp. TaxID=1874826 RepID=UPI00261765EA|nr:hypothetical protein [Novosphingobium sp.]
MPSVPHTLIEIAQRAIADELTLAEVHLTNAGWLPVESIEPYGDSSVWIVRASGKTLFVGADSITGVRTTPPISTVHVF